MGGSNPHPAQAQHGFLPLLYHSLALSVFTLVDYCFSHTTKSAWETALILTSMSYLSRVHTAGTSHRHSGLLLLICSSFIYLETRSHVSLAGLDLLPLPSDVLPHPALSHIYTTQRKPRSFSMFASCGLVGTRGSVERRL